MAALLGTGLLLASPAAAGPESISGVTWLNPPASNVGVPEGEAGPDAPVCVRIRRARPDSSGTSLYVSVLDREGEPVTGLRASDFRLIVDGQSEPVAELGVMADLQSEHLAVVLALGFSDRSNHAGMALDAFASAFVPELEESKADLCAVLTFRGRIDVPRLFSADPLLLKQALSRIHFSGEGMYLNAAIAAARTLIHQHDTAGYGVVIVALDEADSLESLRDFRFRDSAGPAGSPCVYALGIGLPAGSATDPLAALCSLTGGESFLASGDSLAVRAAAARLIRILQGQYVIRVTAPATSYLRLEYSSSVSADTLSDSIAFRAEPRPTLPEGSTSPLHPRLVRTSLLIGAALLLLIVALHLRNRA